MAVADDAVLAFAPFEDGQRPAGPFVDERGSRVVIFGETEEAEVACMGGGEAADLYVVAHEVLGSGELGDFSIEVLLLSIPAGPQLSTQPTFKSSPRM